MLGESHFLHIRAEQIVPTLLFRLHCWMTLNLEKKREQSVLEASNTLDSIFKKMFSRSERDSIWLSQALNHFCQLQLPDRIIWLKDEKQNPQVTTRRLLGIVLYLIFSKSWVAAADLKFLMTAKAADEMFHSFPLERRKLVNTLPTGTVAEITRPGLNVY